MGKKVSGWFANVMKFFKSSSKHSSRNKKENVEKCSSHASKIPSVKYFPGENSSDSTIEDNQNLAIAYAAATSAAAEAAVAAAKAAAQVVRLAGCHGPHSLELEERAAILIQSHYRGYLGRRALQALKGVVKLQALVRGHNVRKRTLLAIRCNQAWVRVQDGVRAHRTPLTHHGCDHDHDDHNYDGSSEDDNGWIDRHENIKMSKDHHVISREPSLAFANYLQHDNSDEEQVEKEKRASLDSYTHEPKVNANANRMTWGNNLFHRWMASASQPHLVGTDDVSDSDRTAEVNAVDISISSRPSRKSRQNSFDGTPSYMAPTQSAKAKVRPTSPARPKIRAQCYSPCNNPYPWSARTSPLGGPTGCDSSSSGGGGGSTPCHYLRCPSPINTRSRVVARKKSGHGPDSTGGTDSSLSHGWRS